MNDREILVALKQSTSLEEKKELESILWAKYQRLVYKNWGILKRQLNNSSQALGKEDDYFSDAYIAMRKCIDAIDLLKIKDDNWNFGGYFHLYIKNVRTSIIKSVSREYQHECSLTVENNDNQEVPLADLLVAHDEALIEQNDPAEIMIQNEEQNVCDAAIKQCMQNWNEVRREIFLLREKGVSKKKVADKLKVHPATITYYMKDMRRDLEAALLAYR